MSCGLSSTRRISTGSSCVMGRSSAKGEREGRAVAGLGLGPDSAAVTLDDPLDDRQANARAVIFLGPMQALEDAEELVSVAHVKAYTIIFDEVDQFRGFLAGTAPNLD